MFNLSFCLETICKAIFLNTERSCKAYPIHIIRLDSFMDIMILQAMKGQNVTNYTNGMERLRTRLVMSMTQ